MSRALAEQADLWAYCGGEVKDAWRSRQIERLAPIAAELANRAGPHGITVADVRHAAVQRGLLTGEERGRELSYLHAVPKAAGLIATGGTRRSFIARSHANRHTVWVAKEFAPCLS